MTGAVHLIPLTGMGEIRRGDDVGRAIRDALEQHDPTTGDGAPHSRLADGDVVVVSSKIVAKAEGQTVTPRSGESVAEARERLTLEHEVLVQTPFVTVVRTPSGLVCANAGIDASNVAEGSLLLLPTDPDASAAHIRDGLADLADVGVVISDTFGRAWRDGQTDVAIGVAGLPALRDERGNVDRGGRVLDVTLIALADQIAGAADLVRDKAAGVPVVVVRGLAVDGAPGTSHDLIRSPAQDLFPHGRGWLARRLATGEGVPVRTTEPTEWEWALVVRATGGRLEDRTTLRVTTGYAAGLAEAALLDFGFAVVVEQHEQVWIVTASGAAGPSDTSNHGDTLRR
ncbi:coenzyme F420-0:L-glutamate ligase [Euzebya tangerina]|uniref:coenzyme F420-0:L-glutamate ligase n=1 Tax=Euzebya tangerina TaxID=591198 RepID=UPI000E31912D|nr:coenzyme F420-0:L-glutamate ligase [Euzebya tangerina]